MRWKAFVGEGQISSASAETVRATGTEWSSEKARYVLASLQRIGWRVKRTTGSHRVLARAGSANYVFAFHDREEIGPRMMARIARGTGLTPTDL